MLTSSKKPQYQWLRKLLVLPVAAVAIALFGFTYTAQIKAAVAAAPDIAQNIIGSVGTVKEKSKGSILISDTVPARPANDAKTRSVSAEYETGKEEYMKLNTVTVIGFSEKETPKKVLQEGEAKIDVQAKYPGNWRSFLERNINLQKATQNGAPPGKYLVEVQFIVNEDGQLSGFAPLTNEGYGMEEEVVRVLKSSTAWGPAINNQGGGEAKPVKSYRTQPVEFIVYEKDKKAVKEEEIFTRVEINPKYPGNWRSFLERNLNGQVPVDNGAAPGNYTTIIQFIVDRSGNVSDIKALSNVGHGLEEEAIRVIKASGKWQPAIQNGREVKAYHKQPITFQVMGG